MSNRSGAQGGPHILLRLGAVGGSLGSSGDVAAATKPSDRPGKARWYGTAYTDSGFALIHAWRDVLLCADPPVPMARRAVRYLAMTGEAATSTVQPGGTVITRDGRPTSPDQPPGIQVSGLRTLVTDPAQEVGDALG